MASDPTGGAPGDAPPTSESATADADDPLLGQLINERYLVDSIVGRGGMGRVYSADQVALGRKVAIKTLRFPKGLPDAQYDIMRERFFLEAATNAKLQHANIVTVFDYGRTEDGLYYIVMELLEGCTLGDLLARSPIISAQRTTDIAIQVARALTQAHKLGVVHRDLKPNNIFLVDHGDGLDHVKLLDFGLVKYVQRPDLDVTHPGTFVGTPFYMSPEHLRSHEIDGRGDIYSLGVILYEMLAGRRPFETTTIAETVMAHLQLVPEPLPAKTPPFLSAAVMRCLEKQPDNRFAEANRLVAALESPANAETPEVPLRTPELPAPQRRVGGWAAAGFVAAAVGMAAGQYFLNTTPEPSAVEVKKIVEKTPPQVGKATGPVMVVLESQPSGARVTADNEEICRGTPCTIEWGTPMGKAAVQFRFELAGHDPALVNRAIAYPGVHLQATLRKRAPQRRKKPPPAKPAEGTKAYKENPY